MNKKKRNLKLIISKVLSLFTLKKNDKICFIENTKCVAGQHFDGDIIRNITHASNRPPQQKTRIKMGLSRKDLWRILMSNGMDILETNGRYKVFEDVILVKTLSAWTKGERNG